MKKPRGRPVGWRAKNPRIARLLVKLTLDERAQIELAATKAGENLSQYVRESVAERIVRGDKK